MMHTIELLGLPLSSAEVLIGILQKDAQILGLLVLLAGESADFTSKHISMLETILEPFSIALENHLRVRELAQLREAAEADKRYLTG